MSRLLSKIDAIEKLWFEPLRAKPVKALKAVYQNGTTVILGADGVIYLPRITKRIYYQFSNRSLGDALDACIKMGVLTDKAVAEHRANEAALQAKKENAYCAEYIVSNAQTLGIQFTKAQQKIIDKAKGG
jgi:hypothetical protein